jgi:hypothetical protein
MALASLPVDSESRVMVARCVEYSSFFHRYLSDKRIQTNGGTDLGQKGRRGPAVVPAHRGFYLTRLPFMPQLFAFALEARR